MANFTPDFFIVGIGASAGGVQALEEFFSHVRDHPNAAFVVLQHLSPDFRSMMSEILQRKTRMQVRQVVEKMTIEPGMVYVMPPGKNLIFQNKRFCLVDRSRHLNYPINLFFESMAKEFAERSIGVVMTGGGSDGTEGLMAISRAGGVALAQTPDSAPFESMPASAIASGIVDKILEPHELARAVYDIVRFSAEQTTDAEDGDSLVGKDQLQNIVTLLDAQEEIDFSEYKTNTLRRRIQHRCALNQCDSVTTYIERLKDSEEERTLLRQSLLIGTTRFFRDGTPWPYLKEKVLPELIALLDPGDHLRLWVSACSTGEEAYTMAMIVDEAIRASDQDIKAKIFATDIDTQALAFAGKGRYPANIANHVSAERLNHYFIDNDGQYQVKRFLREMLIVAPHDLTKNAGFSQMHVVSCRNVLIYMQPHLQQRVLRLLHFTLAKQGVLFLGSSETLGEYAEDFEVLQAKDKIYRKKKNARKLLPSSGVRPSVAADFSANRQLKKRRMRDEKAIKDAFKYAFGDRQVTCLLVNRENKLTRIFHNSAELLELSVGEVQMDVVEMVPQGLKLPLETALHRARREKNAVSYTGVTLRKGDEVHRVDLQIGFEANPAQTDDHLVAIIEIIGATSPEIDQATYEVSVDAAEQISALEYELAQTKENLQVTIEELETINEEQQATNEELLASNEELQSTNEELQSVNEELYTVNAEYQRKINELVQLNEDVNNLLRSTNIGVVFLDLSLDIRKFTPAAASVINLRPGDVNRPISDFTSLLTNVDLRSLAADVLRSGDQIEREVHNSQTGEALLLRAYPYIREDGDLNGVVLTFVEVTDLKRVQFELQTTNTILETVYATSPVGFALQDEDLRFVRVNKTLAEINNWPVEDHIGRLITEIIPSEVGKQADAIHRRVLETGQPNLHCEFEGTLPTKPGEYRYWNANYFPVELPDGRRWVASVVTEMTSLKKAQRELQASRNFARQLSESNPGIIYIYDMQRRESIYLNSSVETVLGYSPAEVKALGTQLVDKLVHPEDIAGLWQYYRQFEREPDGMIETEIRVRRKFSDRDLLVSSDALDEAGGDSNQWRWLALRSVVFSRNEDGSVHQVLGLGTDITPRKESEERLKQQKQALESAIAAAQAADSANQAKSEFLANMSHEIRTPMNLILGTSQLLERTPLNARQQNLIEVLRRNGETLLMLINDVLDLSKLEAQELKIEKRPFSLPEMLTITLANFKPSAEAKGLSLSLELAENLPNNVVGDSFRLQQILRNLLSNAVKFTAQGSVVLGASRQTQSEGVATIRLYVRDTGIGIAKAKQADLFEPFIQSDASSTRQYGGTGLGLTISRRIVELMDGEIGIESALGEGATFWLTVALPLIDEPQVETAPVATPPEPPPEHLTTRVLIAEDNEDNQHLLIMLLEDLDYLSLETANDGVQVLEKAASQDYDLILMDCQMPQVDGYEATARLRASSRNQNVPIIALTANAMQGDRQRCLDAGMDDYLSKPVMVDKLLDAIARWTNRESEQ